MQLTLQRRANVAIYRQIVEQVREQIRSGQLPAGSRLPPVRALAAAHGLTRLTAHSAYSELQALGLVESHVGRGTFVSAGNQVDRPVAQPPTPHVSQGILAELLRMGALGDVLSFAQAFPAADALPVAEFDASLRRAVYQPGALGYGDVQGEFVLRTELAAQFGERGLSLSPDALLVTAGAQQGIDLILRATSRAGAVIVVEEPVYPGILELAAVRGQRVVGVPNENGELRIDLLEAACATHHPSLLYLVPTFNNPTGRQLTDKSAAAVLRLASEQDLLVVEDDSYGLLGFDGTSRRALKSFDADDRVVYISSVSKALAPAFRLGAVLAPASLLPALAEAKQSSDLVCSALLQRTLADYLRTGHMTTHLGAVRALYRQRCAAMLDALQRHLPGCTWTSPEGGLSLWVNLPDGIDERDFTADALRQGVGVAPGAAFFPQPRERAAMRLSFGAHAPQQIEAGIALLGEVLRAQLARREGRPILGSGARGPLV